jgi:hypothetical protein
MGGRAGLNLELFNLVCKRTMRSTVGGGPRNGGFHRIIVCLHIDLASGSRHTSGVSVIVLAVNSLVAYF